MLLTATPMVILYGLGLLLTYFGQKGEARIAAESAAAAAAEGAEGGKQS